MKKQLLLFVLALTASAQSTLFAQSSISKENTILSNSTSNNDLPQIAVSYSDAADFNIPTSLNATLPVQLCPIPKFDFSPGNTVNCASSPIQLFVRDSSNQANSIGEWMMPTIVFTIKTDVNNDVQNKLEIWTNGRLILRIAPTNTGIGTPQMYYSWTTWFGTSMNNRTAKIWLYSICSTDSIEYKWFDSANNGSFPWYVWDSANNSVKSSGTFTGSASGSTTGIQTNLAGISTWSCPTCPIGALKTICNSGRAQFLPQLAKPGKYGITYTFDNGIGCSNSHTDTITINPLDNANWNVPPTACLNGTYDLNKFLTPCSTLGGTWSGTDVTGNNFTPLTDGLFNITYAILPQGGGSPIVVAHPINVVKNSSTYNASWQPIPLCSGPYNLNTLLTSNTTSGGIWSGNYVTGNVLNAPNLTDSFPITYTLDPGTACELKETHTIKIFDGADAAKWNGPDTVCRLGTYNLPDYLSPLASKNGIWIGKDISGNKFSPKDTGYYKVTYSVSYGPSCFKKMNDSIYVKGLDASWTPPPLLCTDSIYNLNLFLSPNSATGGTWSGTGVSGNTFSSSTSGQFNITYAFTSGTSCNVIVTHSLIVNTMNAAWTPPDTVCTGLPYDLNSYLSSAATTGGIWSGAGVLGNTYYPGAPGANNITYSVGKGTGCGKSISKSIYSLGDASWTPPTTICTGSSYNLNSYLSTKARTDGTWSGVGVSGNTFLSGASGQYNITYTVGAGGSCNTSSANILDVVSLDASWNAPDTVCSGLAINLPDYLTSATTAGGYWTGSSIFSNTFYPSGVGPNTITYTVGQIPGCQKSSTHSIYSSTVGDASWTPTSILCINQNYDLNLFLDANSTKGGTWSGIGVSGNTFSTSTTGLFSITYSLGAGPSCSGPVTHTLNVVSLDASWNAPDTVCSGLSYNLNNYLTSTATVGGIWSGPYGVSGNVLYPGSVGSINITYTVGKGTDCEKSVTHSVYAFGVATWIPPLALCADSSYDLNLFLTTQSQKGGIWSGIGVSGNTFSPDTTGAYNITYTLSPGALCSDAATNVINVIAADASWNAPDTICSGLSFNLNDYLTNTATNGGGWSGSNVYGSFYYPTGNGPNNLTYTVGLGTTCETSVTHSVYSSVIGNTNWTPPLTLCADSSYNLNLFLSAPSTVGGTWSGLGVSGNYFSSGTPGQFSITYSVSGSSCSGPVTHTLNVGKYNANWTSPDTVCLGKAYNLNSYLSGSATLGGIWSGAGVIDSMLYPSGPGTNIIGYKVGQGTSCETSIMHSVYAYGDASWTPPSSLCPNSTYDLNQFLTPIYSRTGGVWSGQGVSGNNFSSGTNGSFNITYSVGSSTSCAAAVTHALNVVSLDATWNAPDTVCSGIGYNLNDYLSGSASTGGIWSGMGVSGNMFYPSGTGSNNITYTVGKGTSCEKSISHFIYASTNINAIAKWIPPSLLCSGINYDLNSYLTTVSTKGGAWSGSGVVGNNFIANTSGYYTITYTLPASGCLNNDTHVLTVIGDSAMDAGWHPPQDTACTFNLTNYINTGAVWGGKWSGLNVYGDYFIPNGPGLYNVTYTVGGGMACEIKESHIIDIKFNAEQVTWLTDSCKLVWPGDANRDLVANNNDILAIGVGYGSTGPVRDSISTDSLGNVWSLQQVNSNWVGQWAKSWGVKLNNGIDYKNVDCNGDGTINANDTLAVIKNYGLTHNFKEAQPLHINGLPDLTFNFPSDTINTGSSISVPILLGNAAAPANGIYGVAFTVTYDPTMIDSSDISISYTGSWLGTIGSDLISITKHFDTYGQLDIAIVRTDHQNKSSYGKIAELNLRLKEDMSGQPTGTIFKKLLLETGKPKSINNIEMLIPLNIGKDSVIIKNVAPLGIREHIRNESVKVYPNPASSLINVEVNATEIKVIQLANILGETVRLINNNIGNKFTIDTQSLSAGTYFLSIITSQKKIVKQVNIIKD